MYSRIVVTVGLIALLSSCCEVSARLKGDDCEGMKSFNNTDG